MELKLMIDLIEEKSDKRLKEREKKGVKKNRLICFCLCKMRDELGRKNGGKEVGKVIEI